MEEPGRLCIVRQGHHTFSCWMVTRKYFACTFSFRNESGDMSGRQISVNQRAILSESYRWTEWPGSHANQTKLVGSNRKGSQALWTAKTNSTAGIYTLEIVARYFCSIFANELGFLIGNQGIEPLLKAKSSKHQVCSEYADNTARIKNLNRSLPL